MSKQERMSVEASRCLSAMKRNPRRKNKYGVAPKAERTYNKIVFASKKEMLRFIDLERLQKAGEIFGLKRQVRFPLEVNEQKVCDYVCDFVYCSRTDPHIMIVEDVKGKILPSFRIKEKLFHALKGFKIKIT